MGLAPPSGTGQAPPAPSICARPIGFPILSGSPSDSAGLPLHSWVFTKGHSRGALTPTTPSEGPDSTAIEVEDIPSLLRDVARFAEAVEKLKDVVLAEGRKQLAL